MPLDSGSLAADITSIASDPPATSAACATAWAEAVGSYANSIVPPSTTVSAAQGTLEGALAGAFASPAAAPAMESAFTAFALTVSGGMAPAFIGTPPAGPVGFATLFLAQPATHAAAGSAMASLIHNWMTSGTATPSAGGPAVPWS